MGKNIWIRASVRGCQFGPGKLSLELVCGHHAAIGESVHAHAVDLADLGSIMCFTRGMINSSQNALVQISSGWAPIGKLISKFELRHGVSIRRIVNDFSRDGDIECVETREDAEKLCLLSQRFQCCAFSLLEIAEANGFNIDNISARALRSLRNAIAGKIGKHLIPMAELHLDKEARMLVLAGK